MDSCLAVFLWTCCHTVFSLTPENSEIQDTHRVVPLPAYNQHHDLIRPADYEHDLAGAITEIYFVLYHYHIAHKKRSVSTAVYPGDHCSSASSPTSSVSCQMRQPSERPFFLEEGKSCLRRRSYQPSPSWSLYLICVVLCLLYYLHVDM